MTITATENPTIKAEIKTEEINIKLKRLDPSWKLQVQCLEHSSSSFVNDESLTFFAFKLRFFSQDCL